ncbi:CLUMA_CG009611, isoform A [Clunio marinus]|uniref:CLUMA_CG009611, isoform A n=1 Tax=Clunio marinus TaxID=568069 RepID=A0A1J1IB34_9DIPT|nr:CLUMA_CG009611, isoform A [Clunio marinus]
MFAILIRDDDSDYANSSHFMTYDEFPTITKRNECPNIKAKLERKTSTEAQQIQELFYSRRSINFSLIFLVKAVL